MVRFIHRLGMVRSYSTRTHQTSVHFALRVPRAEHFVVQLDVDVLEVMPAQAFVVVDDWDRYLAQDVCACFACTK